MRVIGGEAKGRRLVAPKGEQTRPTADRVRESLFNILRSETRGARVLDLFAGTGAMAIEALSRGAARAVLVDSSRLAADAIRRNLLASGYETRARLLNMDWRAALSRMAGEQFTLIFLDPPYRMAEFYWEAAHALSEGGLLAADALLVMEHDAQCALEAHAGFVCADMRRYGKTAVGFFRHTAREGSEGNERMSIPGKL